MKINRCISVLTKLLSIIIVISCEGILFLLIRERCDRDAYSIFKDWQAIGEKEDCISNIRVVGSPESGVGILTFEVKHGLVRSVCFREDAKAIHFYVDMSHKNSSREDILCEDKGDDLIYEAKRLQYRIPWQTGKRLVFWRTLLSYVLIGNEGDDDESI